MYNVLFVLYLLSHVGFESLYTVVETSFATLKLDSPPLISIYYLPYKNGELKKIVFYSGHYSSLNWRLLLPRIFKNPGQFNGLQLVKYVSDSYAVKRKRKFPFLRFCWSYLWIMSRLQLGAIGLGSWMTSKTVVLHMLPEQFSLFFNFFFAILLTLCILL